MEEKEGGREGGPYLELVVAALALLHEDLGGRGAARREGGMDGWREGGREGRLEGRVETLKKEIREEGGREGKTYR